YPGSTDNYRVSGITDTGFFFTESDTRPGRTITWLAAKGEIPGKLKAGRINSGDGNTVRFTTPFTGNADTIGVGFTRSKPVHELGGDECCVVMDVTNNGFRWGGDATDRSSDYPFYWIAMQGTFTVEGENAPAIMAGKIRQNGNRVGGQLYIDYPAAFANPAVSAVLSKDWSVRDEQMPWVAIPSNPQEAKSRFYRGGDQAEQPGGLCLGRLCVSSPYNNRWIAMDRTYLSPQAVPSKDSLSALFKVSSNRGLSGFKPTFSVSDMGGTARGDVHYQLYCEAGVASTLKEPPRSAHTSHAWNGDCEYVVPAGQMSVTKTAEIIVERGTAEPIKARFDITVYNSKFTLYKDRSDTGTNVTPGGSEVIHPATGSKQFTYDITKPEFTGKVIIEQLGAAPVQRTVTVSVTPGTVDPPPCGSNCPTDNPEPTTPPTTPSPGPTDGENPNYGEGSGSF
ncbi:MAG: hypothetical protein K0S20_66, partial [Patescibacteria group bacterium]|nr:hypothetical protein [Patescibacteria group bacterium]